MYCTGLFTAVIFISAWALTLSVQLDLAMQEPWYVGRTTGRFHAFLCQIVANLMQDIENDMNALINAHTLRGRSRSPYAGLTSNVLPKAQSTISAESSQTGVSTKNALLATKPKAPREADIPHWYALRTTYGREKMAYDYMTAKGITAFYPTTNVVKLIKGKRKVVTKSRLPNIFFAYGTEEQLKEYVFDNVNLPFLRFYYRHIHEGNTIKKTPLIVPDNQMDSLKIICAADADNTFVSLVKVPKFEKGQLVKVTDGAFKGVIGRVARWQGQQRVGVVVDDLVTVVTAYIPSAFIESIE